jgi:hypothetical protein
MQYTITIESRGTDHSIIVNGYVRCVVSGTREMAEREAERIGKGLEADARWMARRA